ncbi:hypothetical protein ACVOMT_11350 [Sphingomonas panni]
MIESFFLSVAQLGDRAFLRVLAKSLALTLVLLALVGAGLAWGALDRDRLVRPGRRCRHAGDHRRRHRRDRVGMAAVPHRRDRGHRPVRRRSGRGGRGETLSRRTGDRPTGTDRPVAGDGGKSILRTIAVNLFFVPLYLLLLATGIGTAAVFFVVNGWLLGRDLSDMVAARHLPPRRCLPSEVLAADDGFFWA